MFAEDSIALLKASGINFSAHQSDGISVEHFGELLMASGLVLVDDVRWLSFHSGEQDLSAAPPFVHTARTVPHTTFVQATTSGTC